MREIMDSTLIMTAVFTLYGRVLPLAVKRGSRTLPSIMKTI